MTMWDKLNDIMDYAFITYSCDIRRMRTGRESVIIIDFIEQMPSKDMVDDITNRLDDANIRYTYAQGEIWI